MRKKEAPPEAAKMHDPMAAAGVLRDDLSPEDMTDMAGTRQRLGVRPPQSIEGYIDHDRGRPRAALAMRECEWPNTVVQSTETVVKQFDVGMGLCTSLQLTSKRRCVNALTSSLPW
eukprot:1703216-Pyramimonas_sp.AAC.1